RGVHPGHRARHAVRHVDQPPGLLPRDRDDHRRRPARPGAQRRAGHRLVPRHRRAHHPALRHHRRRPIAVTDDGSRSSHDHDRENLMPTTTTIRSVRAGDVTLEIAEAGIGGRPLLMVHGFTGAKEDFADYWERLAERGWHVVAPDLRGHGASDHPTRADDYSLDLLEADLMALVDEL